MFSFTKRSKQVDLQRHLRRLADVTTPNNARSRNLPRAENRYNRVIPTLVCPWEKKRVVTDRCVIVLTRDIADHGVGLIATHPFSISDMVLGFWLDMQDMHHPWFFRGMLQREVPIGGGFWLLGVELLEFMNESCRSQVELLAPLAKKLLPPSQEPSLQ